MRIPIISIVCQKMRSIISIVVSTVQRSVGPVNTISVCVAHLDGKP